MLKLDKLARLLNKLSSKREGQDAFFKFKLSKLCWLKIMPIKLTLLKKLSLVSKQKKSANFRFWKNLTKVRAPFNITERNSRQALSIPGKRCSYREVGFRDVERLCQFLPVGLGEVRVGLERLLHSLALSVGKDDARLLRGNDVLKTKKGRFSGATTFSITTLSINNIQHK